VVAVAAATVEVLRKSRREAADALEFDGVGSVMGCVLRD
jgi:hypothetical protein